MDSNQQDLVAQFCGVTGSTAGAASTALASANWNLQEAVALYFAAQDGEEMDEDEQASEDGGASVIPPPPPAAPSSSQPAAGSSSTSKSSTRKAGGGSSRLKTLADLQNAGHDSDDSNDSETDLFTGGEKSGLAVQPNPNPAASNAGNSGRVDHFRNILNQARKNEDRPPVAGEQDSTAAPRSSAFAGPAQTLGGDDAPSRSIPDPNAPTSSSARAGSRALPMLNRTMHLWADGVSIDDGPLFRFDDPANAPIMAQINRGQAPLSLLDVQPDQEVDLKLEPHKEQTYVQPKKKWKPFEGGGQRLGAPTPGPSGAVSQQSQTAAMSSSPATTSSTSAVQNPIDSSLPTLTLQIRLADGSRLSSRFNTTQTIGDVYSFVDRAASGGRAYALMTTFPSKELEDKSVVLGDMSDFKRGGVVVQKLK